MAGEGSRRCWTVGVHGPDRHHGQDSPCTDQASVPGTTRVNLPDDRLSFWTGKYPMAGEVLGSGSGPRFGV